MDALRERLRHPLLAFPLTALILFALVDSLESIDLGEFGRGDFLQYWTAAKLYLSGGNPYDLSEMTVAQRAYNTAPVTILQWNPPMIFPLTAAFSLLSFSTAALWWLVLMAACCAFALVKLIQNEAFALVSRPIRLQQVLFLATFYPFAASLYYGQISPLLLFGFVVLLLGLEFEGDRRVPAILAGMSFSLTLLKPHLLYLVYLWLLLNAVRSRSFATLAGLVLGGVGLTGAALLVRPDIVALYAAAIAEPPIYWQTPTLGSWLQLLSNVHEPWVRLVPSALTLLCLALMWVSRQSARFWFDSRSALYVLVPLSLLTSPYGWQFDHVLLLPTVLWCFSRAQMLASHRALLPGAVLILLNVAVLLTPPGLGMQHFWWYPSILFLLAWGLERETSGKA